MLSYDFVWIDKIEIFFFFFMKAVVMRDLLIKICQVTRKWSTEANTNNMILSRWKLFPGNRFKIINRLHSTISLWNNTFGWNWFSLFRAFFPRPDVGRYGFYSFRFHCVIDINYSTGLKTSPSTNNYDFNITFGRMISSKNAIYYAPLL